MRAYLTILIVSFFSVQLSWAQNITFSITNKVITSTDVSFDVNMSSDTPLKLGSGQLYFNFNTAAFGQWVVGSGRVTISFPGGSVLSEQYLGILDIYDTFITNDNTASRFSFAWQQAFSSGAIVTENITSSPALLFQVAISYDTGGSGQSDDICFEDGGAFDDQTFTACGPTTAATADCFNHPGIQLLNDVFDCSAVLPVELVNFRAEANQDQTTWLEWQTANEYNNDYFSIERSFDGQNFKPILEIAGAGNSQQVINYEATDHDPQIGTNYYRLKQTDLDGAYEYSEIRTVTFSRDRVVGMDVFPNPANQFLHLKLNRKVKQGKVKLYSGTGQLLRLQSLEPGSDLTKVLLDQLSAGMYWLSVEADGEQYSQKVIIARE